MKVTTCVSGGTKKKRKEEFQEKCIQSSLPTCSFGSHAASDPSLQGKKEEEKTDA